MSSDTIISIALMLAPLAMLIGAFIFAELVRATILSRYMPGMPQFRLAVIMAVMILAVNAVTEFLTWVGLLRASGSGMDEDINPLLIFLVCHPLWWIYRLLFARLGEIVERYPLFGRRKTPTP